MEAVIQAIFQLLTGLIAKHAGIVLAILIGWPIFSCAVSAMPSPKPTSSGFYTYFYAFCHALAANPWRVYFGYVSKKGGSG